MNAGASKINPLLSPLRPGHLAFAATDIPVCAPHPNPDRGLSCRDSPFSCNVWAMRLAVNIDHIATIREARKADEPDPVAAAIICELAGAQGITVHLRGDRRHIQDRDVELLKRTVTTHLNVEMAGTTEMGRIAQTIKPH